MAEIMNTQMDKPDPKKRYLDEKSGGSTLNSE